MPSAARSLRFPHFDEAILHLNVDSRPHGVTLTIYVLSSILKKRIPQVSQSPHVHMMHAGTALPAPEVRGKVAKASLVRRQPTEQQLHSME